MFLHDFHIFGKIAAKSKKCGHGARRVPQNGSPGHPKRPPKGTKMLPGSSKMNSKSAKMDPQSATMAAQMNHGSSTCCSNSFQKHL